jgi:hypothetical protein
MDERGDFGHDLTSARPGWMGKRWLAGIILASSSKTRPGPVPWASCLVGLAAMPVPVPEPELGLGEERRGRKGKDARPLLSLTSSLALTDGALSSPSPSPIPSHRYLSPCGRQMPLTRRRLSFLHTSPSCIDTNICHPRTFLLLPQTRAPNLELRT